MSTTDRRAHFPPVERIRPGIWTIPVPIPQSSLGWTFVYVFETDRGPYIVDAGWDSPEGYAALSSGLVTLGSNIADVQGVLVTHLHPDHYGLAAKVREASGAWVGLHPADTDAIHDRYEQPEVLRAQMMVLLSDAGMPEEEIEGLRRFAASMRPSMNAAMPDVLIEDGDRPEVPGWDLLAIWTPGHSPGHLCFYEEKGETMLTGDHVLPGITPSIPLHPQAGPNPLGDYLASLERVAKFGAYEALPAHEHRFSDLPGRIAAIEAHHEERLEEAARLCAEGYDTAWELATLMHWARPWSEITGFARRAAVLEALAHLRVLEVRGAVRPIAGVPVRWECVAL